MRITILGAGNSGCAHAAKLVENGHEVMLVKTSRAVHNDNFYMVQRLGGILMHDNTQNNSFFAKLLATTDVCEGIQWADVVMVLTQSLQHKILAEKYGKCFRKGQIVFLIPGNLGSLWFRKYAEDGVIFVEGESTPYDARIVEPGCVHVLFKNVRNAVAVSSHHLSDNVVLNQIDQLFDSHKYLRRNIVESAMHNPNMIVHTIGTIMSASRIELMKGEFWMYRESFSPAVWNLVNELDREKNIVIETYGGTPLSYLDACKWRNEEDLGMDSLKVFQEYANTGGPQGPSSLDTRFMYEDVPMGLGQLELLAKKGNVDTPLASALITIASSLMGTDYREIARTHSSIAALNKAEIIERL